MGTELETEIDLTDDVVDQDMDAEDRGDELTEDQMEMWEREEAEEAEESDDDTDDEALDDDEQDDGDLDDQDNADTDGDQQEPEQKGSRTVPHGRFHEVNEQLKQERAERLRLEEELARARGTQKAQQPEQQEATEEQVQQAQADSEFDFDKAEGRYNEAIYDGDMDAAKQIRAEIRAAERKAAEDAARAVLEQERAQMRAQQEQQQLQGVVAKAYEKYPFLDPQSGEVDQEAVDEVIAMRNLYLQKGMTAAEAIAKAVDKVGPRYTDVQEEEQEQAPKKSTTRQSKETLERNIERADRIPPTGAGVGERARKVDYSSLSEAEFANLSEQEKRRARGDFL